MVQPANQIAHLAGTAFALSEVDRTGISQALCWRGEPPLRRIAIAVEKVNGGLRNIRRQPHIFGFVDHGTHSDQNSRSTFGPPPDSLGTARTGGIR
jgi:hypothetical protein